MLRERDVDNVAPSGATIQKKSSRACEQDREDVRLQRVDWVRCQSHVDPERFVFLDETGLKTDMNRLRGWANRGHRLVEAVPGGHWATNTLVHAVALDGTRAAMVLDGPIDSISFTGFCRQFLAPSLKPGDLVVLDNLSSHKTSSAIAAVHAVGAKMVYLPPYSPDLNPIENLFSKLKQLVRGCRPRNWKQIVQSAKKALLSMTHQEIQNAFEHCG